MKAIVLMFDSLNKRMLSAYGNNETITPNFKRLQERTVVFENYYVGSMPCMPARREMHTGRYNFLHRGWSPLEPFDNSVPEILKENNIHSHLVTDHYHYWRDGGATYHNRFSTYEFIRGQEGDPWKGIVDKPRLKEPEKVDTNKTTLRVQHQANIRYMKEEKDHQLYRTIDKGLEFIHTNYSSDNWFLQLECFDPHEPFFVPKRYLDMYGIEPDENYDGFIPYYTVTEDDKRKNTIQTYYKALLTMVDEQLGRFLDIMDKYNLWDDTLLIVNTDHGLLLGEHDWWAKMKMPLYNEIANTPFFISYPKNKYKNERRYSLAQTIDIAPTILEHFNIQKPKDMLGKSLAPIVNNDTKIRDYALFGYHGCHINITDGKHVYMRSPQSNENTYEYTLMPTKINRRFKTDELKDTELHSGFKFTKGLPVLKIPAYRKNQLFFPYVSRFSDKLYNLVEDPKQTKLSYDKPKAKSLLKEMVVILKENDAPKELYERYKLDAELEPFITIETELDKYNLEESTKHGTLSLINYLNQKEHDKLLKNLRTSITDKWSKDCLLKFMKDNLAQNQYEEASYNVLLDMRVD